MVDRIENGPMSPFSVRYGEGGWGVCVPVSFPRHHQPSTELHLTTGLPSSQAMKLLDISGGSLGSNTEHALLTALRSAKAASPTPSTVSLIRLKELKIGTEPLGTNLPLPLPGNKPNRKAPTFPSSSSDDRPFILNAIMEADGIILGAPCITRAIPWVVKSFQDNTPGPFQDLVMARKLVNTSRKSHLVDLRIFKPRVLTLVTLGGAQGAEWAPFSLPLLHQVFFPMGIRAVDQMQLFGMPVPGSFLGVKRAWRGCRS